MAENTVIFITVGIDVGGTNTDVAIRLESDESKLNVIASAKSATTKDITTGIVSATKRALKTVYDSYKDTDIYINCVSIGTTHFVNAIEQRSKELSQVCVIRLCGPVSTAFEPFIDIPNDLKQIIEGCSYFVDGGYDYNGKSIGELESKQNQSKIDNIVSDIKSKNIKSIAITGIFSPMKDEQEIKFEEILRNKLGNEYCKDTHFTLSHKIAGLGLLQRENACILNAAICKLANKTIESFRTAMKEIGITSTLYLTKNDGTQCLSEDAIKYPITTFASGPTNSMKGAALLCDQKDISNSTVIVCDIGGTTSDIGVLVNGFIQLSATKCKMAGIETNFAVPNVISRALGGGTIINYDKNSGKVNGIGPKSVGYNLIQSKCFENGNILTLTDIAVLNGNITPNALCNTYKQKVDVNKLAGLENVLNKASDIMISKLAELVDAARGEHNDLTLILCGGGAKLIPSNIKINGIKNIVIPKYAEIANAIGAASYRISAHLDVMHKFEGVDRDQEIEKLKQIVIDKAEAKGAKKGSVSIATFESIPIAYIPGDFKRILIKAVGDVDFDIIKNNAQKWKPNTNEMDKITNEYVYEFNVNDNDDMKQPEIKEEKKDDEKVWDASDEYKRQLSDNGKIWTLSSRDIDYLSIGCGVIGTGGGGSTRPFDVLCKQYLESGNKIRIVKPEIISSDCNVICVAFMGAPAMLSEKLMNGSELLGVVEQMINHLQIDMDNDNIALICGEIGGCNGLTPIIACAQFAEKYKGKTIDLVDADFMGRAFPELQMILPSIHGKNIAPIACEDEYGNKAILKASDVSNNKDAENKMRFKCVELGMKIAISLCPLKGRNEINRFAIPNSYEFAWKIGKIISDAKKQNVNPLLQLQKSDDLLIKNSKIVYYGKIVNLERNNDGGFNKGSVKLQKINNNSNNNEKYINSENIYIDIQNENYLIRTDEQTLITVPDLIVMFDDDYTPIATEELRYGLRVTVMIFPAHPLMKTNQALKVVGPAAFGYKDVKYIPIENFQI